MAQKYDHLVFHVEYALLLNLLIIQLFFQVVRYSLSIQIVLKKV